MEKSVRDFLEKVGQTTVAAVVAGSKSIGRASGEGPSLTDKNNAPKQVRYELKGDELTVYGPEQFKWVEGGRRAGAAPPPSAPLIEWMKRMGIAPGQENRVVWAIKNKIVRDGIKPRPFLRKALTDAGVVSASAQANTLAGILAVELGSLVTQDISGASTQS